MCRVSRIAMIYVTRLNHTSVVLNSDLIEHVEATPDTVISMTTGERLTVLESAAEVVEAVRRWRRSLFIPEQLTEPHMEELHGAARLSSPQLNLAARPHEGHRHG
jgi:flagellar protein FlbD